MGDIFMLDTFIKRYAQHDFLYTTSVRHSGKVVALALALERDTRRPILLYTVLDPAPRQDPAAADGAAPTSPLDVHFWSPSPQLLAFPDEIAEVGYGVVDQTRLPVFKQGQSAPEEPGTVVPAAARDNFLSTTARLTAPHPFHVLSDGKHIYVFRQAVAADHQPPTFKLDADHRVVTDAAGKPVPLVDSTLLVDRFVLVGHTLVNKREVRFQRSRSKTRPQSRKDSLGDKDLDGHPFIEPTLELSFVSRLTAGRFTALLIPTLVAGIQRWQLFAQNAATGLIDSYSVERSDDGLFNLKGTRFYTSPDPRHQKDVFEAKPGTDPFTGEELIPFVETTGHAESALKFDGDGRIDLGAGVPTAERFTIEAWILPTRPDGDEPQALIGGADLAASRADPTSPPAVWIDGLTRLRIGFGDGARWLEHATKSVLTPDDWNHVAITFDGKALRVFINGRLRDKAEAMNGYVADAAPEPTALADNAPASPIVAIGATQDGFTGTIDEVRIWHRARSAYELRAEMNQRLTGRELGLAAYWRFDEASGNAVFDQTDQRINGTCHNTRWVTSEAPVGTDTGLSRSSFAITTGAAGGGPRSIESGITALLYHQQAEVKSGYDTRQKKRLKQSARVMLAVATKEPGGSKNEIAVVDLGVAATGTIAEVPDLLGLEVIQHADQGGLSINQRLDQVGDLESRAHRLDEEIVDLDRAILALQPVATVLDNTLADAPLALPPIDHHEYRHLNQHLRAYRSALAAVGPAEALVARLDEEREAARVAVFEDARYGGRKLEYGLGSVSYGQLSEAGFNDLISSIQVPAPLEVRLYEHLDRGGRSRTLAESTDWVGDDWNDIISSMDIGESPAFQAARTVALVALTNARTAASTLRNQLAAAQSGLQARLVQLAGEKTAKQAQLQTLRTTLAELGNALRHGVELPMPHVAIDRRGLTISGAVLGFAWTSDTPRLFDSATGSLALYFRGVADQFFVTYYTTLTERARYPLAQGIVCEARSADLQMDQLTITVSGAEGPTCTVTIAGAEIEEVWSAVPRDPEMLVRILNGASSIRELVGWGTLRRVGGQALRLDLPRGVQRTAIPAGRTLVVGATRVVTTQAAAKGDTRIEVTSDASSLPTEELPVYHLEYDYERHARTTKVPNDLYNGSLLIRAARTESGAIVNQRVVSGTTLKSKWTAESPGSTLAFDGARSVASLADLGRIRSFDAGDDLTMEAWLKPASFDGRARVLVHRSPDSAYALGLEQVRTGLVLDGALDHIDLGDVLNPGTSPWTVEIWFRCDRTDGWNILYNKENLYEAAVHDGFFRYAWQPHWTWEGEGFAVLPGVWYHAAVVYDGQRQVVYRNGEQVFSRAQTGDLGSSTSKLLIGARGDTSPQGHFKGAIGEVRVWRRARTAAEIRRDRDATLAGDEADLAGYWRHQDSSGTTIDLTSGQHHGQIVGLPQATTLYRLFAGVNERYARSRQVLETDTWTHLAVTFGQSYALGFDGSDAYLDCGAGATLDINGDLTLELKVRLDGTGLTRGLLTKGRLGAANGQVPYALAIDGSRQLRFEFEDEDGGLHAFVSEQVVTAGTTHRVAVTRKRESVSVNLGQGQVCALSWHDIRFFIDGAAAGHQRYAVGFENLIDLAIALSAYDDPDVIPVVEKQGFLVATGGRPSFAPPAVGRTARALEIGRGHRGTSGPAPFHGVIGDVRIWSRALEPDALADDTGDTGDGLIAWWQFEERGGTTAGDQVGNHHGTITGAVQWVEDPSTESSSLLVYRDGVALATTDFSASAGPLQADRNQFGLGALKQAGSWAEHFQGEMEELRIWQSIRTQEQIQDNMFRRLTGEHEQLIAYYSFDAIERNQLTDQSNRGNHLELAGTSYILSSAPIGVDTPQVRSALAGVKTPFHGTIQGQPGVAEYGDMQYDSDGNLIGTFKRCYSIIRRNDPEAKGEWHLITGFKVGDLVTEWIGQIQFAPQLQGYIEGAPPVPSENLAATGYVRGEFGNYVGASSVTFTEAETVNYTYAANQESTVDLSIDTKLGAVGGTKVDAGLFVTSRLIDVETFIGLHATFESSWGWLAETVTSVGHGTTQDLSMSLRGSVENQNAIAYPHIGRRFVPDNVGMAFVISETADLFALRLKHNHALVAFQARPNPDIPADRNIITFPINPRYTRQGTLDGKVGLEVDPNYPNAQGYSADVSYFKLSEAYRLKREVEREAAERGERYDQYDASGLGRGPAAGATIDATLVNPTAAEHRRNLVNSYVWTADGGLFAESEETMSSHSETSGGSFDFKGMAGVALDLKFQVGAGIRWELDALLGGSVHRTVSKSKSSDRGFALAVDLGGVESDLYLRNERNELVMDLSDPRNPTPKLRPGRVDAYRFMSFYLEPDSEYFETFFNKVVDPIWLESDDPSAAALREARQDTRKPPCWRILHRVTYVSRVLPPLLPAAPASLEKSLQTLDIDSNYQLIRQLEPFVRDQLSSEADFARAVDEAVISYLPELQPHLPEIKQYLRLYFGIAQGDAGGDEVLGPAERPLDQPPIVDAGPDQVVGMDGAEVTTTLEGNVIDDRLEKAEAIFVTWQDDGSQARIAAPHALTTTVEFRQRGRYALRLTADDGTLSDSDETVVTVNQPPDVSAGTDQQVKLASAAKLLETSAADDPARSFLEAQIAADPRRSAIRLEGRVLDDGLGDPALGRVALKWSEVGDSGKVVFADETAATTLASFADSGHFLLRLTADNGSFSTNDEVTVAVAARVTDQLQALYTFEEGEGAAVHDVAGLEATFDLEIVDPQAVRWVEGGLALLRPTVIRSAAPATRLTGLLKATGELTIEAWITPAAAERAGLGRIATLSAGVGERNITLGQAGDGFHVGLRTTTTNPNASDRALTAAATAAERLTHLVCTHEPSGITRLYVDGVQVAERLVGGALDNWAENMPLALGNEPGAESDERAWLGTLHLVALYSRALTPEEIEQNHLFGADADLPPVISAGEDVVVDAAALPASVELRGRVTHDRPTPDMKVSWSRVAGPGDVVFGDERALATSVDLPQHGRYLLRLSVSDDHSTSSDAVAVVVHTAPRVDAGADAHVSLPEGLVLAGQVLDSGLGTEPTPLTTSWRQESGPATATFVDPTDPGTTASFPQHGAYSLVLSAGNGRLDASDRLRVYVHAQPQISASAPPIVTLDAEGVARVPLTAAIDDAGLGDPAGAVTVLWKTDAAAVTFEPSAEVLEPTAVISRGGLHTLKLEVGNGHLSARHEVAVTINQAPHVDPGPPQTVVLPAPALLDATIGDDGLPLDPGSVRLQWQQVEGTGQVEFADPGADTTLAHFSRAGRYVLRITADDGAATTSATTTVEVVRPPRIATGLLALYRFDAADAPKVRDGSGRDPLDLEATDPEAVSWTDRGLTLLRPTLIRSAGPAVHVIAAIKASQAFTIETWITADPGNPVEATPARIVTISLDHGERNTTLGQEERGFSARVRTSTRGPDDRNGIAQQLVLKRPPPEGPLHLVYVCDLAGGTARLYADGVEAARRSLSGDMASWDDGYAMALGNELAGERAWLGSYHLVAVYDRALAPEEVAQNFYAGPPGASAGS